MVGTAFALKLLFGLAVPAGIVVTGVSSLLLMGLSALGVQARSTLRWHPPPCCDLSAPVAH